MKNVINKLKIVLIVVMIFNRINIVNAKAYSDINLNLSENGEKSQSVFTEEDGVWFPGMKIKKNIILTNNTGRTYRVNNVNLKLKLKDSSEKELSKYDSEDVKIINEFNKYAKCKLMYINEGEIKTLYTGEFNKIASENNGVDIDEILIFNNENKNLSMTVNMDGEAGNLLQGVKAEFSIKLNAYSIDSNSSHHSSSNWEKVYSKDNSPVLVLIGKEELDLEIGQEYVDAGARAYDEEDGDITDKIQVNVSGEDNKINMDKLGMYTITYDVTDSDGNKAKQVVRIVNVKEKATVEFEKEKESSSSDHGKIHDSKTGGKKEIKNKENKDVNIFERLGVLPKTGEESPFKWYLLGGFMIVIGLIVMKKVNKK